MKKILLLCMLLLVGCASIKTENDTENKTILNEKEYIKQQEKYEFELCTSLTGGVVSRCENFEAVCYIVTGYDENMGISCFKKG